MNIACVGIFWLYKEKIFLMHSVPVAEGISYGDSVTGTRDHAEFWDEAAKNGKLNSIPDSMKTEYFSVPRGRVVYHRDTDTFSVYHGNNVHKSALKSVCRAFNIPPKKTVFEMDLHYCTLSDSEWNSLFL